MVMLSKRHAMIIAVSAAMVIAAVGIATAYKYTSTPEIQGSANLAAVIENFIKENRKVTFESATKTAEASRADTIVIDGRFTVMQGYLVYAFRVVDPVNGELYSMIIDAGNGSVLYTSEPVTFRSSKYSNANIAISMSTAASNAVKEVADATVESGRLIIDKEGNATYTFIVRDGEGKFYKIRVSAVDGSIIEVVETRAKYWQGYWHGHEGYGYGHGHGHGHEYSYGLKHEWKR